MSQSNAQNAYQAIIKVTRSDLPLHCPRTEDAVPSTHPRDFLPVEKTGSAACPDWGARYELVRE